MHRGGQDHKHRDCLKNARLNQVSHHESEILLIKAAETRNFECSGIMPGLVIYEARVRRNDHCMAAVEIAIIILHPVW